jgi:hypothetical protein
MALNNESNPSSLPPSSTNSPSQPIVPSVDDVEDPEPFEHGRRVRKATERGLYTDNPLHRAQKKTSRATAPSKKKSASGRKGKKRRVERVLSTDDDTEADSANEDGSLGARASALGVCRSVSPHSAAVEPIDIEVISLDYESSDLKASETPAEQMSKYLPTCSCFPISTFNPPPERLKEAWTSPIYVFFHENPKIEVKDGRRTHLFTCAATRCKGRNGRIVRRFLDTGDAKSTSNLCKHAKNCWSKEAVAAADECSSISSARSVLSKMDLKDGSIAELLTNVGPDALVISPTPHSKTQIRMELVRWIAESKRPFAIVEDPGFIVLMKTGRLHLYLPSTKTLSRDRPFSPKEQQNRQSYPARSHICIRIGGIAIFD